MKDFFHRFLWLVLSFVTGVVVGICLPLLFRDHTEKDLDLVQRDTVVKIETIRYSPLQLADKRYKLDLPKIDNPVMVFVQEDSTSIIYRDSVRYVTLPREYFYTNIDDTEIWHSGIDSTIDSLVVRSRTESITETCRIPQYRHSMSLYGNAGYDAGSFTLPVGMEYLYHPYGWIGIGGKAEYDIRTKGWNVMATAKLTLRW